MKSFTSLAPGRLCLFGEHQDYLGLPVVALALPLYCRIHVQPTPGSRSIVLRVVVAPPLSSSLTTATTTATTTTTTTTTTYDLDNLPHRQDTGAVDLASSPPDFCLAALHEASDSGWELEGAICTSTCDFVMQAGCSSSSAFCVAWIQALARLASVRTTTRKQQQLDPLELAQRAHQAEVTHFGAPGGTMDHVTSAVGGLLRIGPGPWQIEQLPFAPNDTTGTSQDIGAWVLAYSGEEKDTMRHLNRCKTARLELLQKLGGNWDTTIGAELLDKDEKILLQATRTNRDTETEAVQLWTAVQSQENDTASTGQEAPILGKRLGELMMRHHEALRDGLCLSTEQLERLNAAASNAGAWGFKVVGSGGGGCGVAWSSADKAAAIAQAMKDAGAPITWIIQGPSEGAHIVEESVTP